MHGTIKPSVRDTVVAGIDEAIRKFDGDGIYIYEHNTRTRAERDSVVLLHPPMLRKFLRSHAKAQKRPFVYAEITDQWSINAAATRYERNGKKKAHLVMPRTKRLEAVGMSLLLASESSFVDLNVWPTIYSVKFPDIANNVIWQNFLHRCRTDPVFRKALGAPVT